MSKNPLQLQSHSSFSQEKYQWFFDLSLYEQQKIFDEWILKNNVVFLGKDFKHWLESAVKYLKYNFVVFLLGNSQIGFLSKSYKEIIHVVQIFVACFNKYQYLSNEKEYPDILKLLFDYCIYFDLFETHHEELDKKSFYYIIGNIDYTNLSPLLRVINCEKVLDSRNLTEIAFKINCSSSLMDIISRNKTVTDSLLKIVKRLQKEICSLDESDKQSLNIC